jgi:hypothetical protein
MKKVNAYIRARSIQGQAWRIVRRAAIAAGTSEKSDAAVVRWAIRELARRLQAK